MFKKGYFISYYQKYLCIHMNMQQMLPLRGCQLCSFEKVFHKSGPMKAQSDGQGTSDFHLTLPSQCLLCMSHDTQHFCIWVLGDNASHYTCITHKILLAKPNTNTHSYIATSFIALLGILPEIIQQRSRLSLTDKISKHKCITLDINSVTGFPRPKM